MLLQLVPGGVLPLVVTVLVASVFYAVTLHLAATFYIGEVPSQRAAYVAPVPAGTSILLGRWGQTGIGPIDPSTGVAVAFLATLLADAVAISFVYRLKFVSTVPLVLLHLAFAAIMGIALGNVLGVF